MRPSEYASPKRPTGFQTRERSVRAIAEADRRDGRVAAGARPKRPPGQSARPPDRCGTPRNGGAGRRVRRLDFAHAPIGTGRRAGSSYPWRDRTRNRRRREPSPWRNRPARGAQSRPNSSYIVAGIGTAETGTRRSFSGENHAADQRRRSELFGRDLQGNHQFPRMDRQRLGHLVLPPEGLHAGLYDRAGLHGRTEDRVRQAELQDHRTFRRSR